MKAEWSDSERQAGVCVHAMMTHILLENCSDVQRTEVTGSPPSGVLLCVSHLI